MEGVEVGYDVNPFGAWVIKNLGLILRVRFFNDDSKSGMCSLSVPFLESLEMVPSLQKLSPDFLVRCGVKNE